jgi:hypothetical protein
MHSRIVVATAAFTLFVSLTQTAEAQGLGAPPQRSDYARRLVGEAVPAPGDDEPADPRTQAPSGWEPRVTLPEPTGDGRPVSADRGRAVGLRGQILGERGGSATTLPAGSSSPTAPAGGSVAEQAPPLPGRRPQARPQRQSEFQKLWEAYPRGSADEVKARIGGGVDMDWVRNTCAIRVSHALNQVGERIRKGHRHRDGSRLKTTYGDDGSRYIYQVSEMRKYLEQKHGKPTVVHHNPGDGGAVPPQFLGKQGIILFDVKVWDDATGHVDVWDGEDAGSKAYFDVARSVYLWELD